MDIQPKQLLMIAYYFPPLGGAGVQRSAKFAKYLARQGWQVKVVTVFPPSFEPLDDSLEAEVHHELIQVVRVKYRARFRQFDKFPGGWRLRALFEEWLSFPDRMQGWISPALKAADKICRENPGIVIFSTSAPYSAHLVGLELKHRFGYPWIADFRDEWSQNPYFSPVTNYHLRRHQAAELSVLSSADAIISVTENITRGLQKIARGSKSEFHTIPNGFDPDDLTDLTSVANEKWTLTHVGTLNKAREPLLRLIVQAVKDLIAAGVISSSEIKLQLIGAGILNNCEFSATDWLEVREYLPHAKALELMNRSDLAIVAEPNPAAFTGKIFEYLGLQKTILGLVYPGSPAADLIKEAQAGWVVGLEAGPALTGALTSSYQNWHRGCNSIKPRPEVIGRFNREHQAEELARIVERIRDKSKSSRS